MLVIQYAPNHVREVKGTRIGIWNPDGSGWYVAKMPISTKRVIGDKMMPVSLAPAKWDQFTEILSDCFETATEATAHMESVFSKEERVTIF